MTITTDFIVAHSSHDFGSRRLNYFYLLGVHLIWVLRFTKEQEYVTLQNTQDMFHRTLL
jgi:hypothetical protein